MKTIQTLTTEQNKTKSKSKKLWISIIIDNNIKMTGKCIKGNCTVSFVQHCIFILGIVFIILSLYLLSSVIG